MGKIKLPLKYLFEFLAVLLGIFGGFWLQEMKEENERNAIVKEIMLEISNDLKDALDDIKNDLLFHRQGVISNAKIQEALRSDLPYADSLCFDFYFIKTDEYTFPLRAGFERLKNISVSTEIPDSIYNDLSDIYESLYPRISKTHSIYPDMDEYFEDYYQRHFRINEDSILQYDLKIESDTINFPQMQNIGPYRIVRTIGFHPVNFAKLKADPLFRMMLLRSFEFRLYKYNRYSALEGEIIKTIENIQTLYGEPEA